MNFCLFCSQHSTSPRQHTCTTLSGLSRLLSLPFFISSSVFLCSTCLVVQALTGSAGIGSLPCSAEGSCSLLVDEQTRTFLFSFTARAVGEETWVTDQPLYNSWNIELYNPREENNAYSSFKIFQSGAKCWTNRPPTERLYHP